MAGLMCRSGGQGSWKDAVTPYWMIIYWKEEKMALKVSVSTLSICLGWSVVWGRVLSSWLWHMLALQLLQEKVKDHLSPAHSALRKVHCATK